MHISDLFSIDLLQSHIEAGHITRRESSDGRLLIYNYTASVQYGKRWDDVTLACRGLITDKLGHVVAVPFPKFFNYGELTDTEKQDLLRAPRQIAYEKMDGSLGICFYYDGMWQIATRGSFNSDQAIMGTLMLHTEYAGLTSNLDPHYTYLFEICGPENRIVVSYDENQLVLLAATQPYGPELDDLTLDSLGFPRPARYEITTLEDLDLPENKPDVFFEGWVVKAGNLRYKVKIDEYVRAHKVIFNLTPRAIWEAMFVTNTYNELLYSVPDEFYNFLQEIYDGISLKHRQLLLSHLAAYDTIDRSPERSRKDIATQIVSYCRANPHINSSILFNLLDGKPIDLAIAKLIDLDAL